VTGRTVHDALLRTLTSAELRQRLAGPDEGAAAATLGPEEARVLREADPERLRRLARFMARHFYRERIVRLFAASRALARRCGVDPLDILKTPAFDALLEMAELGSAATAEQVAAMVETTLRAPLERLAYGPDLVTYEGALFRAEAGPRRWHEARRGGQAPVRSGHTRLAVLDWDVTALVTAIRRGDPRPPEPARTPTRLLIALGPGGRVSTVRCPEAVERLLGVLDGARSVAEAAEAVGVGEADAARVLRQLAEVGAVEWAATPPASPRV
jgi:hypothetical protein